MYCTSNSYALQIFLDLVVWALMTVKMQSKLNVSVKAILKESLINEYAKTMHQVLNSLYSKLYLL